MVWPSLSALRVFECAGRSLSFTRAAAELNVTQAAVSHQIRALEQQLGVPLFRRTTRRLELSPAGRRLLPAATAAFQTLGDALSALKREERILTITTTPSFGASFLAPRLGRFADRHPAIEVQIRHSKSVLDLAVEAIDVGIRWGRGKWPGVEAEFLGPAALVPVASPDYVARLAPQGLADIARARLLHDETHEDWVEWLMTAGLDPAIAERGVAFDDDNVRAEAARTGQGVALMSRSIVGTDVAAGRLAIVFDLSVDQGYGYYLVMPPSSRTSPKVAAFRTFLFEEMARRV